MIDRQSFWAYFCAMGVTTRPGHDCWDAGHTIDNCAYRESILSIRDAAHAALLRAEAAFTGTTPGR